MRDPRGSVSAVNDRIERRLLEPLPTGDFLRQPVARELVRDGLLVDFELPGDTQIVAPRLAWVSQPSEWCRAQLLDAAHLTVDIAERALPAGFELKDASAWNVIFDGCAPLFCDHLSFEKITRREWRALGQFARHFILPLVVASRTGLPIHAQFRMFRDGITPELARTMCGWRMLFSRAAPLLLAAKSGSARVPGDRRDSADLSARSLHGNLLRFCRSSLPSRARIEAGHKKPARGWSGYMQERDHYSEDALARKLQQVRTWIERTSPSWVLDLGANTGEFSMLAAQNGARVIAVDSDHDCIERLYLGARGKPVLARAVHPVLAQLDDLCGGRGWSGSEAPGIVSRLSGHCDLVMALGLVHHLMIACAIPVAEIAEFTARLTSHALILETVPEGDPMFQKLAQHYDRTADAASTCGEAAQVEAFARHFDVVEQVALPASGRRLWLLTKKPS
jgi:hypothetical protein